ncbi:MAG: esterase family protein [Clostridia bacterium]|nr:esterase family protein [Clostridia bacterium]
MAFLQTQFFSKALDVAVTVNVILPEPAMGIGIQAKAGEERPPRVLYLLHGYSDDHSIWMRRTSIERYAAPHNLAVVMPAVNHSFYTNEAHGERYWDFVSEELPKVVQRFFRVSAAPEDTYVAGLSMGGYGAMKLALTHPERFAAAASFSGAVDIADMGHRTKDSVANMARIFGEDLEIAGTGHDLFHLLKIHAKAARKPRLYVSCGTDDFLYHMHGKFVSAAEQQGWDVTHREIPGRSHEWGLWDTEVLYFIEQFIAE